MSQSTFSGPIKVGPIREGPSANLGTTVLAQFGSHAFSAAAATTSSTIVLPANSRVVAILVDIVALYNHGTSDTLSVGKAASGQEYITNTSLQSPTTVGRLVPAYTAAQLTKMANIGSDTNIVLTVAQVGTTGSAGSINWAVLYTIA